GLASGISAGSVTLHEGPTRIDIAEIEPAIVEASHEFDAFNHRPLADPRVWMMVNDARNHLLLSEDAIYDLVISEPSNPWITGVSNLFTREFFEIGQRKMSADGVWAQWVHVYSIDPGDLRSLLFTFADVYKHVLLFRIDQSDLVILGSAAPMSLDGKKLQWILNSNAEVMADFAAVDVHRPEDLLGQYMFSEAGIRKLADAAGMAPRNTDDNMRIEYSTPLFLYRNTIRKNLRMIEDVAEIPMDAVEGAEGLSALARVYAKWDQTPRRTLEAIRAARSLDPGDLVIQMQSQVYERGARVRIKGAQGRQAQDPGGEARLWASD
ncbi:MAG: hypothetical protein ACE5ID_05595, partial [Acidobacteriota bacterium]